MLGFIAQNARSAWAESSLGAPKMLLVLILGWAEAEVSRAGMSSPCAGDREHGALSRCCLVWAGRAQLHPDLVTALSGCRGREFAMTLSRVGGFVWLLRGVLTPVIAGPSAGLCGWGTTALGKAHVPELAEVFFIPCTKAHSLLSQIRMKRFPFQLLPPSLCDYLNPQLRGFSANKLPSFQVAFPFSHCFWQSVHVKLY